MKLYPILIAAALVTAPALTAQELNEEVTVDHTVVTQHYDASRIAVNPLLNLPAVKVSPLRFSERTINVTMPRYISPLEPTAYADTLETSPYAGYASIGYFPIYNLAASAGYRFLDTDRQRLNAWMQFDGTSYKDGKTLNPVTGETFDAWLPRNTLSLGVTYHLMVGRKSEIDAGIDYTLDHFRAPGSQRYDSQTGSVMNALYGQTVNRVNAAAQFLSSVGGLHYTAGFSYGYFGYSNGALTSTLSLGSGATAITALQEAFRPVRSNVFNFNGAAWLPIDTYNDVFLGVNLDVLNDTRASWLGTVSSIPSAYTVTPDDGAYNTGLLSLNPKYRLNTSEFKLTLGALVQFTFHSGKVIHIAPDVQVTWSPASVFTIWGKAGGGEHQNTLARVFDVNYMAAPFLAYRNSHLPLVIDGGIVVGPFKGIYGEVSSGYAVANDWLMPAGAGAYGPSLMRAIDMKGWHVGLAVGGKWRNWIDGRVSIEAAPQKYNRGYYLWADRAKYVMDISLKSNPIKPLEVGIGYSLRACRYMIEHTTYVPADGGASSILERRTRLGNIGNIGINGKWTFTDQISFFLEIENLLDHRYRTVGLVEGQGIRGLAGVTYQF